jgi:hypothetical protein
MGEGKITNMKSSCTIMTLKVGLTSWTSLSGNTLVEINEVPPFVIIYQFEYCCLCKCICTADAEINQLATKEKSKMSVSAFPWEKKWLRPYVRWKADSQNVNTHNCRALRAVGALGKQTASHSTVNIGGGRRLGR